jgi:hypothetical protein
MAYHRRYHRRDNRGYLGSGDTSGGIPSARQASLLHSDWMHLDSMPASRRIVELRKELSAQILGAIVVLVIAGLFVGVLPLVADSIPDPNELAGGQRSEFANGVSFVTPGGWSYDPVYAEYGYVILNKSGTIMSFLAPEEATGSYSK